MHCNATTGDCDCVEGFSGRDCSICPPGRHNIEEGCPGKLYYVANNIIVEIKIFVECPACYQNITEEYVKVRSALQQLNMTITQSRSNYSISDDLSYRLENVTDQIDQLTSTIQNLILNESNLDSMLNQQRNESEQLKINVFDQFSHMVNESERILTVAMEKSNSTQKLLVDINLIASLIREILEEKVEKNITFATVVQHQILSKSQRLQNSAEQLNAMIMQREQSLASFLASADNLTNNSHNSFTMICDTIEQENTTLSFLRGAQEETKFIDTLFEDAKEEFIGAKNNVETILNTSDSAFNFSSSNSIEEELYSSARYIQESINTVFEQASDILKDVKQIQSNYSTLNNESENITHKLALLKNASDQLVVQIKNLGISIDQNIEQSETAIQAINQTLSELETYLQNVTVYFYDLTSVLININNTEEISVRITQEANHQKNVFEAIGHNISNAISLLETTNDTIGEIIRVSM